MPRNIEYFQLLFVHIAQLSSVCIGIRQPACRAKARKFYIRRIVMKKVLAFALVLVLVVALAAPACAISDKDDVYTLIQIESPPRGPTSRYHHSEGRLVTV